LLTKVSWWRQKVYMETWGVGSHTHTHTRAHTHNPFSSQKTLKWERKHRHIFKSVQPHHLTPFQSQWRENKEGEREKNTIKTP
jgi:hypothetical protein